MCCGGKIRSIKSFVFLLSSIVSTLSEGATRDNKYQMIYYLWCSVGGDNECTLRYYSLFTLTSAIKGANCVECKLLHCEYRASKGVDYQSMPLQFIGVFWFYMFPTCNLDDFGIKRCGI